MHNPTHGEWHCHTNQTQTDELIDGLSMLKIQPELKTQLNDFYDSSFIEKNKNDQNFLKLANYSPLPSIDKTKSKIAFSLSVFLKEFTTCIQNNHIPPEPFKDLIVATIKQRTYYDICPTTEQLYQKNNNINENDGDVDMEEEQEKLCNISLVFAKKEYYGIIQTIKQSSTVPLAHASDVDLYMLVKIVNVHIKVVEKYVREFYELYHPIDEYLSVLRLFIMQNRHVL